MTFFSILPLIPILIFLLWRLIPVRQKSRWVNFLPAAGLGLLLLHILVDGFQPILLGLYIFSLVLFLINLGSLIHPSANLPHWRVRAGLGGLLGLVLLALSVLPAVLLPFNYHSTPPTGPYAVGTVTYGWEDQARPETYTADAADHRKIAVQFWYPVNAALSPSKGALVTQNAPLSDAQGKYPLVVFSHGAFGVRSSNTTTYLELASHGYIVASIDHTYHAFYTSFPDGKTTIISQQFLSDVQRSQAGDMSEAEALKISFDWLDLRTADIRFTLDQIKALNTSPEKSVLSGHIDENRIGLFGHSLGGAASATVCRTDSRCKAAIVIDATMFGEYDRESQDRTLVNDPFPKPLLIFYNGDTYNATPDHQGYVPDVNAFNNSAASAYSVVVNGAQHLNFTDLPARAPVLARLLGSTMSVNGGTTGAISQARCMEILDRYVLDFFNQTLLSEPSILLSGNPPFPEVEFSVHSGK